MNLPGIVVRRAPVDFADWERVRALILDAFAYMEGRIDPPSSALRLTPQSMAAAAATGTLLLAELGALSSVACPCGPGKMRSTSVSLPCGQACTEAGLAKRWSRPRRRKRGRSTLRRWSCRPASSSRRTTLLSPGWDS